MTNTERALAILNYEPYDRLPIVHFGYWAETLEKWVAEGHLPKGEDGRFDRAVAGTAAGPLLGFDFEWYPTYEPSADLDPPFERKIVKTFPDGSTHVQDSQGVIVVQSPNAVSIPAEIDHLLKDRASWEEHFKPRLQWSERRMERNAYPEWNDSNAPQGLHCGSLIGTIRDRVGMVGLSYMMVDDEELLDEIIETVADLCLRNVKEALASGRRFDFAHFWEDICFKNGPLINPTMFEEKIGPYYKRITEELNKHGVDIVSVDCDGCIDMLVPIWLANGVNTMFPIEVGTWKADIKPWRDKYGKALRGVGGMNKNLFALDRGAIDAEIERLKPLVALGGYIPCPDHRIPPTAKWDLVRYYCDRMRAGSF